MNNKPRPGSLACDACRHKHLKCDGASPICGRCALEAQPCSYTASRRGQNRRGKRGSQRLSRPCPAAVRTPLPSAASPASAPTATANAHDAATAAPLSSSTSSANATLAPYMNQQLLPPFSNPPPPPAWSLGESEAGRLRSVFYANFFAAHPFLVPKSFYATQCYPHYLDLVVCFAGHHYVTPTPEATGLRDAVASKMSEADEQTPCRVQALILYAILLHSRQEPQEAASCIARAANVAIHLGMHDPNFARTNSAQSPVREESLRRTWWELYTIDIYCAAIHRRSNFETFRAHSLPLLPCTQAQYEAGECDPCPPTIQAFEDSVFSPDNRSRFSSYCFRIDAIRIVSRVLALATRDDAQPDDIQALDNALASWDYNLPSWCVDVVTPSGEVDLMLFQARCFILCAGIFLHFPRSELPDKVPSANDIACSRGYTQLAATSRHHAIKAIAASKEMSNLATVPWPLEKHSPFFVCGLVLGCVIQLATGSVHVHRCGLNCLQQHEDRVMLMLGALRRLGERWKLAQHATRCLKDVAQNIFTMEGVSHISSPEGLSFRDSAVDSGESVFTNYDWFDLFSADNLPGDLLGSLT